MKILGRKTWQFDITKSYYNVHYFCENDFALLRGKQNYNTRISPMQTLVNVVEAHTGVTRVIKDPCNFSTLGQYMYPKALFCFVHTRSSDRPV